MNEIQDLDFHHTLRCEFPVTCNNLATVAFRLTCGHDLKVFCGTHAAQFHTELLLKESLGFQPQCPESGIASTIEQVRL